MDLDTILAACGLAVSICGLLGALVWFGIRARIDALAEIVKLDRLTRADGAEMMALLRAEADKRSETLLDRLVKQDSELLKRLHNLEVLVERGRKRRD